MSPPPERDALGRAEREQLSGWNGLLWNDYLNCDSMAAQAVLQAEREQLHDLDPQHFQASAIANAKVTEPELEKHKATPYNDVQTAAQKTGKEEEDAQDDKEVFEDAPEDLQDNPSAPARDYSGNGWVQEGTVVPPPSVPVEKSAVECSNCGKQHHKCHCQKHDTVGEKSLYRGEL